MTAFEKRYWHSSVMNGALPICHKGCALRIWLVVSGGEAGNVWYDGRADYTGIAPVLMRDGRRHAVQPFANRGSNSRMPLTTLCRRRHRLLRHDPAKRDKQVQERSGLCSIGPRDGRILPPAGKRFQ
jgi:hypothetical protein